MRDFIFLQGILVNISHKIYNSLLAKDQFTEKYIFEKLTEYNQLHKFPFSYWENIEKLPDDKFNIFVDEIITFINNDHSKKL